MTLTDLQAFLLGFGIAIATVVGLGFLFVLVAYGVKSWGDRGDK